MIRTGTIENARAERRHLVLPNGTGYWRNPLITSAREDALSPQAFLVEQDPGTVIEPHFHQENEFQVVAEGGGTLGRHAVEAITVHYAGAHTGYGPITAGPHGLSYFTLRARTDPGAQFLPGARDRMQKVAKRHVLGRPLRPLPPEALAALDRSQSIDLWAPQQDAVAASLLRLPPHHETALPRAAASRYLLVTGGVLLLNGEPLPRFAAAFVAAGHAIPALRAGTQGVEFLFLQFPSSTAETP